MYVRIKLNFGVPKICSTKVMHLSENGKELKKIFFNCLFFVPTTSLSTKLSVICLLVPLKNITFVFRKMIAQIKNR